MDTLVQGTNPGKPNGLEAGLLRRNRFWRPLAWIGMVAITFTTPSAGSRFLDNPDVVIDRARNTRFAPIGELETVRQVKNETGEVGHLRGTGFLVSPCYIMTAAHVVFGDDLEPIKGKDYSMRFGVGFSIRAAFQGNTIATPVLSGHRELSGHNDWVLMRLTTCIGRRKEFGWFDPSPLQASGLVGRRLWATGYPGDRPRGSLVSGSGVVMEVTLLGLLTFSGSVVGGESGGPVLDFFSGTPHVAGIVTGERAIREHETFDHYSEDHSNQVQSYAEVAHQPIVNAILNQDKAGYINPNSELAISPEVMKMVHRS